MPDLLTSIREELTARLEASRQAVEESDRLRAALRVLDANASDGRASRSPKSVGTRRRRARTAATRRTRAATPVAAVTAPALDAGAAKPSDGRVQRRRVRRS